MKIITLAVSILALSLTAVSQTTPQATANQTPQKAIDDVNAQLADTIAKLSHNLGRAHDLDDSDAKLKKSDQDQTFTTAAINKGLNKVNHDELPAIQQRANNWDAERQRHIDRGCPAGQDRVMPRSQGQPCNDETQTLTVEHDQIFKDLAGVLAEKKQWEDLRNAVSTTTLANFQQEKANNAEREALNAERAALEDTKKKLEIKLEGLKHGIDSCARLLRQKGVTCERIKMKCGAIFEGTDPDLPPSIYDSPCGTTPAVKPRTGGVTPNSKP
jgi:hypothetical protein